MEPTQLQRRNPNKPASVGPNYHWRKAPARWPLSWWKTTLWTLWNSSNDKPKKQTYHWGEGGSTRRLRGKDSVDDGPPNGAYPIDKTESKAHQLWSIHSSKGGQVFIDKPTETRHQMIVKQCLSHEVGRSENKKGGRLGPPISLVHELEQIIKILISELQSCMWMIIEKEKRTERRIPNVREHLPHT
jgi:hypothetical protein